MSTENNFDFDLGVVGLGYVGLPLAVESANSKLKVIGYDVNEIRVSEINKGQSPIEDISNSELDSALATFEATTEQQKLSMCENIVISVPTPLTDYQPDLSYVISAAKTVEKI